MSPSRGSTPRVTDGVAASSNVTLTLEQKRQENGNTTVVEPSLELAATGMAQT
jgi:hypothetical protein